MLHGLGWGEGVCPRIEGAVDLLECRPGPFKIQVPTSDMCGPRPLASGGLQRAVTQSLPKVHGKAMSKQYGTLLSVAALTLATVHPYSKKVRTGSTSPS